MNEQQKQAFRERLNAELVHVHTSSQQRTLLYENAKGEKSMKKRIPAGILIAIIVILSLGCAALAATGAFDALKAVWEDSFRRMNTTGSIDIVDEPEQSAYIEQFEENYGGVKEDLVLITVPGEGDLSLEDALQIARTAIIEKFGTPEEELAAMGVYPTYLEAPYQEEYSQWSIYITPREGENIDEDHDYPAPGEYLVNIDSPSGTVSYCGYYNDDFWPEYALRCWENGSKDYVYEEAQRPGFLKQSMEKRQLFMKLFTEAGYDMTPLQNAQSDEARLRAMNIDICFAELQDDLLDSSDPFVKTAIEEMESRYGITKEDMTRCFFVAIRSPLSSETIDICFSYNFNREAEADLGPCESLGAGYGTRLGYFMICMDTQTGKVVNAVNIIWDETLLPTYTDGLLSRMLWTKDDLPEYYRMMDELRTLDAGYVAGRDSLNALLNQADQVMLAYGGDQRLYTADRPDDSDVPTTEQFLYQHQLTEEGTRQKGLEYLLSHTDYSEEELQKASFLIGTQYDDENDPDIHKIHPTLLVILEKEKRQGIRWFFQFDMELNIIEFSETEGDIGG